MKRWIQEPLVHFVLLAILIFGAHQVVTSGRSSSERTIVITQAEMERLASLYAVESGSLPTEQDMRAIIVDQVQQEALAREATRLGMAEDDTVVQRRLAQKMTFMLSDLGQIDPPSDDVLQDWLTEHADRFAQPLRLSFDHIYFSSDNDPRMESLLTELSEDPNMNWRNTGDPFMLQRRYADLPDREIVRLFGGQFLEGLQALSPSEDETWQGPVRSALGTHLVRITERADARMPPLDEVRAAVLQDWTEAEQRRRTAEEINTIVNRYDVVIEGVTKN
ncbi:MAG: peptidylprolyl isomerase [Hyphomonas sp.]|nr:peptidylprolyl isomerase [Hyphomonas sp.]